MSYRVERNRESGETELIIDGFEKGIADSPYTGIASMKNVNTTFLPGATYVNYKRKPVTLTGATMGIPKFYTQSPGLSPTYYILDDKGQVWYGSTGGGSTWTLLTGNHTSTGNLGYGIAYFKDYLFVFGNNYIDVCGDGTGPGHVDSSHWANIGSSGYYVTNYSAVQLASAPVLNATSLTLNSSWPYISGTYSVVLGSNAQTVAGTFTHGSTTVTLASKVTISTVITTIDVNFFTLTSPSNHMALVAINDVLYFCNGNTIGAISVPDTSSSNFNVNDFTTQQVEYAALLLKSTDRAIWLAELNANLVIAVQNYIYQWDKLSTEFAAAPINENPSRMINILNNIYVFAGQKGNIYISNGYSVSLFKKLPDSFLGTIDPYWVIGGMMFHRNKLWFGAVVGVVGASTAIQGIFSLVLVGGSTQQSLETAGALTFESQNSYGISPTNSGDATNILIDLIAFAGTGYNAGVSIDSYNSAYYNNGAGGIDYNDTTLWGNYEPAIESDLIPVGTILTGATLAQIEFKLDRPMATNDAIRLSYRTSFTGSYTVMGTTTTTVLSDIYSTGINAAQWVQFKAEFKCASSSSSFIPLREMRLHYGN